MIRTTTLLLALISVASGADEHGVADGAGGDTAPETGKLVASQPLAGMTVPAGTKARLIADHAGDGLTSPTALTFDEKGALYIAETHRFQRGVEDNRTRDFWVVDDLANRSVEDRAKMLEKWRDKVSLEYLTAHSEVIKKLSGRGEDGRYAKTEIFADDFDDAVDGPAAGLFAYEGTVFLANIPKLYALRDNDGDGKAEMRAVIEDGFGVHYGFAGHDLNGFVLGPDGRLYGTLGDRGMNIKTSDGRKIEYPSQGLVFRFEPDGTGFEVIHTGLRNPKEIAFDAYGNAITVDNNSDQKDKARLVYIVEGGDSGWRMMHQGMFTFFKEIGLEERPPNRWMEERMSEPANDDQPGWLLPPVANLTSGPSGLTYHPGTGFLESEVGRFLVCDYRGGSAKSGIWSFEVAPKGAGLELVDARPLNWGAAVTDVEYSWDGRVVVTDFVSGWVSHEGGRVYEIVADKPYLKDAVDEVVRIIGEGFGQRSSQELERLLGHPDMRVRTRAELELTRRGDGLAIFRKVASEGSGFKQLHAIWGLGIIARRGSASHPLETEDDFVDMPNTNLRKLAFKALEPLLDHGDAEVRAQTARVLGDSGIQGDQINFGKLLEDSSERVRMFAAISAGKTKAVGSLGDIFKMLETNDDRDAYLRHAGVYAMELMADPVQIVSLRDHESAAVRLAAVITLGRMEHDGVGGFLMDTDSRVSDEAIRLIHDRGIEAVRPLVAALAEGDVSRDRSTMMWRRILHSAYRVGDGKNLMRLLNFALNSERPVEARREALRLLKVWNKPHPVDHSLGNYAPLPERDAGESKAALETRAADLLKIDSDLLEAAFKVIKHHRLDASMLSDGEMKAIVLDSKVPVGARRMALGFYLYRKPADADGLLLKLSQSDSMELAIEGLSWLVKRKSELATGALIQAMDSSHIQQRQQAWKLAATRSDPATVERFVKGLEQLTESGGETGDAIELIEAAKAREEPAIKEALTKYETAVSSSDDPLAAWKPALSGGSVMGGVNVFYNHAAAQCVRCHAAGNDQAGPKLKAVALRGDRRFLLESLVIPGAKVAPGYGMVAATLKDGSATGGMLVKEDPESVELDVAGEKKVIPRSEIAEISEPISSMPPMGALLSMRELRDLVAWLSTEDGKRKRGKEH